MKVCINCGKELLGPGQKLFCSNRCAVISYHRRIREEQIKYNYDKICHKCNLLVRRHKKCKKCGILLHENNPDYVCNTCYKQHGLIHPIMTNYCYSCGSEVVPIPN